jgi:hypothetical protein
LNEIIGAEIRQIHICKKTLRHQEQSQRILCLKIHPESQQIIFHCLGVTILSIYHKAFSTDYNLHSNKNISLTLIDKF